MAENCLPFNIINSASFKALFSVTSKNSKKSEPLKEETHYRVKVLPQVYMLVKTRVKSIILECPHLSFTVDIGSGPTSSFLALTTTGIDKNWVRFKYVLSVREFAGEHSHDRVNEMLEELLNEWGITQERCHAFVHDQGSNFIKAFNASVLEDGDCAAHMLHNVVRNGVFPKKEGKEVVTPISTAIGRARSLIGHFSHSQKAKEKLAEIQEQLGLPQHRLIQEVITRWTSTFDMVQRLREQKEALDAYCLRHHRNGLLTEEEWSLLNDLASLLGSLAQFTKALCRDDSPIGMQIAVRETLLEKLAAYDGALKVQRDQMVTILKSKFDCLEEYRTHGLSHFLDPRFRDAVVPDKQSFREDVRRWLSSELRGVVRPDVEVLRAVQAPTASTEKSFLSSVGAKYTKPNSASQPVERRPDIESEFNSFIREGCEDWDIDPLKWWKENSPRFKLMAPIARQYLSTPATSVHSEQAFSTAKDVYDPQRSRLSPTRAEQLVFLNRNLPLVHYRY